MTDLFTKTKICKQCNLPRSLFKEFKPCSRGTRWYHSNICIYCDNENSKKRNKLKRARNTELQRKNNRLKRFGLLQSCIEEKLLDQDFKCAICSVEIDETAHVDHNHITGEVRDLLCGRCNVLLGHAREDPCILEAAADYLRKWADK